MKALLVEDNPADVRLVREMVKDSGSIQLQHVGRFDSALERLRQEHFDVVLLDLGLPDAQGLEALTRAKEANSAVPIVVLTGRDDESFALEVVRAGAQDYLVKGQFDDELLLRAIRYAIERKHGDEQIRRLNAQLEQRVAERTAQLEIANEELSKEVAERKRAEAQFRVLTQNLDSAVALINERGEFSIVNNSFLRMFDLDEHAEVLNINSRDWSQWRVFDEAGRMLDLDEHPVRKALRTRSAVKDQLVAVQSPACTGCKWLLISAEPILDGRGNVQHLICTYHDITELKRGEEALKQTRQMLETVVNHMPAAVILIRGNDLRLQLVNPAYQAIAPGKEMVGKTLNELWPEAEQDFVAICRRVLETGDPYHKVDEMNRIRRTPDGPLETGYFTWSLHRVRLPGDEGWGILNTCWETTARKQAEQALVRNEKLAALGRLAATIAHEVNNPLAGAMNAIFLASSDNTLPPQSRSMLEIADQELRRAAHVAAQTLGFSREQHSKAPVEMPKLIDQVVDLYARKLQERGIKVQRRYRCCGCPGACFTANAGELRQVISNLLINGMDAIGKNGTLHVRLVRMANVGSTKEAVIRLTIADNGGGIQSENLKRIFEPFFTTKDSIGTGLGLWITRQIVANSGGSIRVRSREGKGTVFCLSLPAAAVELNALNSEGTEGAIHQCAALKCAMHGHQT